MSDLDKRKHPRYAAEVPVAFALGEVLASESAYLNNISAGGVAFNSMVELQPGTVIMLHLPPTRPVIRVAGRVVWCRKMAFQYAVGVEFVGQDEALQERIVEMVRSIEAYQQEAARAGRVLTGQDAAIEWFQLFAKPFFESARPSSGDV